VLVPWGPAKTLGTYSSSWMRPSKVRLSIISRATSIPVVDPVRTGAASDDRKDDKAEAVDEAGFEEGATQGKAAHRGHVVGALVFHVPHDLDSVLADESPVRPRQGLPQGGREDDFRQASERIRAGMLNYPTEWWHWSYGDRYWAHATGADTALYGPIHLARPDGTRP
jgi:hypothetical protein